MRMLRRRPPGPPLRRPASLAGRVAAGSLGRLLGHGCRGDGAGAAVGGGRVEPDRDAVADGKIGRLAGDRLEHLGGPVSWTFNSPARVDTVSTLPLRAVMSPCTDGPPPGPWAWPPWVWPPWPPPGKPWPPPGPCRLPRGSLPSWASWNASARVAGPDDAVARPRKNPPAAPTTRQSTPATSRSRHGERPPPRSYTGTPVASGLVGFCCTACSSRSDGVVVRRRPLADRRPAPGAAGHGWPPPGRG